MTDSRAEAPRESTPLGDAVPEFDQLSASEKVGVASRWRRVHRTLSDRAQVISTVLTALAALAALILSLITTVQINRSPDMSLIMPRILRITHGFGKMYVYIQPTFTVYQKTDVTSVVTSVRLNLTPPQSNFAPPHFYWLDTVELIDDPQRGKIVKYASDPAPIVVTPDKPQVPMLRFLAEPALLAVGRWRGSVTVERQGQSPLVGEFCIDISADNISTFSDLGDAHVMRNDQSFQSPSSTQASNCYRNP